MSIMAYYKFSLGSWPGDDTDPIPGSTDCGEHVKLEVMTDQDPHESLLDSHPQVGADPDLGASVSQCQYCSRCQVYFC